MSLAPWLACPAACVPPAYAAEHTRLWEVYAHPLKGVKYLVLSHAIALVPGRSDGRRACLGVRGWPDPAPPIRERVATRDLP